MSKQTLESVLMASGLVTFGYFVIITLSILIG